MSDRVIESLSEDECIGLISAGGVGRIAYTSRYGLVVLPVNFKVHDEAIVFRTTEHSSLHEDLTTGITGAEYNVAFEIDELDADARQGWSVLVQGPTRPVTNEDRAWAEGAGVVPWVPEGRELYMRIIPKRVTGRRIGPA